MKKTGMVIGIIIALLGLGIIFTPIRIYFLIGWLTGLVFLTQGLTNLISDIRTKPRNILKITISVIITLIGILLFTTEFFEILTQQLTVLIVAGGILLSGVIECFIGYKLLKREKKGVIPLILGILSCVVGISGIIFKNATVTVIGVVVGFFVFKAGVSLYIFSRNYNKPYIIE